jgi:hypothetical protein
MKVASYSQNLRKTEDLGWHRIGTDIKYYQNHIKNQVAAPGFRVNPDKRYYTLTFTHTF